MRETGLADQVELEKKLNLAPEAAATLIATPAGAPVDTALEAGDHYLVAKVLTSEPASTQPLKAVEGVIMTKLTAEKALKAAMEHATARRKELVDGALPEPLKKNLNLRTAPAMDRGGVLADFAPDAALAEAVFAARPGTWLTAVFAVNGKSEGAGALSPAWTRSSRRTPRNGKPCRT